MNPPAAPGRPRRRATPLGLLGSLVLIATVERTIASQRLSLVGPVAASYGYAARASLSAAGNDCLCLGDSLMKYGVAPRVIEARSGMRAINLASFAGAAPMTYFMFRRALDAGARPGAVFVDFKATLLQPSPAGQHAQFAEALSPSEALDLARALRDPTFFARFAAQRCLASLRTRPEIREWVCESLEGRPRTDRPAVPSMVRNWDRNRGGCLLPTNPDAGTAARCWNEANLLPPGAWACDPVNALYVKRFLDLAARRGIPVYWLVPPIHPAMQARRDGADADAGYDRLLRDAVRRYPNLTLIDGRRAGYPARVFVDGSHLDRDGATALSADLAALLTGDRSDPGVRPRWRDLPAYRPRPDEAGLEDLDGSWVALTGRVDLTTPRHPLRFRR